MSDPNSISVVGQVDLSEKSGKITFVGPGSGLKAGGVVADDDLVLEIRDASDHVLRTKPAALRRPTCEPGEEGGAANYGLVQETLPRVEGMAEIVLKLGDLVLDRFAAAQPPGVLARIRNKFSELAGMGPPRADEDTGGNYTVQVREHEDEPWQTIATNQSTPLTRLDPEQFPGKSHLTVRVLALEGFDWKTVREQKVDLDEIAAGTKRAGEAGETVGA
jgi:hypothetical protein